MVAAPTANLRDMALDQRGRQTEFQQTVLDFVDVWTHDQDTPHVGRRDDIPWLAYLLVTPNQSTAPVELKECRNAPATVSVTGTARV
jgi:hypothetical protein